MKRRTLLQTLLGSTVVGSMATDIVQGEEGGSDRLVGAHYYTWYGPDNHWDNGYTGTPTLGEYDSKDSAAINQHVSWAEAHGINWFNITWWGPKSYSAITFEDYVAPHLSGTGVDFSVLYEPKGRFDYGSGRPNFDEQRNRQVLADDLTHFANTLTDNPNYLHIDGKPVLYVYIAHSFDGDVDGAFRDAQLQAGQDFYVIGDFGYRPQKPPSAYDAVSPYNMYRPVEGVNDGFSEFVESSYESWYYLAKELDFEFDVIPLTLPGFDNTKAKWATDGQPVLDRSPERYRDISKIAHRYTTTEREAVLITSFNEWHEYTSIEPAESFGDTYLSITKEIFANGPSRGPQRDLVPLRFHWQDYIEESPLSEDIPPGDGRRLTIAVQRIELFDGNGTELEAYDIGGDYEPVATQGISGAESHEDITWRWLTANKNMASTFYIPEKVAESARHMNVNCRALKETFPVRVTIGEGGNPAETTATPGWGTITFELSRQTSTPDATTQRSSASSTETHQKSANTTSHTEQHQTPSRESTSQASTPGFGVRTAISALGLTSIYRYARSYASCGTKPIKEQADFAHKNRE